MVAVPWQLVLKQTPTLLLAAGELLGKSRSWFSEISTAKDLNALRDRCAELAKDQQAYAELVKQLTDQLNAITQLVQATRTRVWRCTVAAGAGVVFGLAACAIALLR